MIPKSISATALHVAELCPARYKAEQIDRGKRLPGTAADLGTAVHSALEMYVTQVYLQHAEKPSLQLLQEFFRLAYMTTFGKHECEGDEYEDGVEMLDRWFERTNLEDVEVLSAEVKENFLVPSPLGGEIPFNYIWDRHDKIGDNEYKVVDYKTIRWAVRPADLKKKIQARAYGLAAQIKYKDAERIWVEYDLLRHEPVGIVFTREENIATWQYIKKSLEKIINTPDDDVPEILNPECRFCIRKLTCKALESNIAVGGTFGISTAEEAIDKRAALEWQIKAIQNAIEELDNIIIRDAKQNDKEEYETDLNRVTFGISRRRAVDPWMVEKVVGGDIFSKYGGLAIKMADFDRLIKSKDLTREQKAELQQLIYFKNGEPTVKVESKNGLDDE